MTEQQAHYLLIYMALIAFALMVAAIGVIAAGFAAAKLITQLAALAAEARGKVYPIMDKVPLLMDKVDRIAAKTESLTASVEEILADAQPKIKRVTTNIADTSDVYRDKASQVGALITDTTDKARRQSDRVDSLVTTALTRTGEIAAHMHNAIMAPARQLSGVINGAKASIDALVHQFGPKAPRPRTPKPVAFEGESSYTGLEDDYHA